MTSPAHQNLDAGVPVKEVERWVRSFVDDRRAKPDCCGDNLISELLATEVGATYLTDAKLVTMFHGSEALMVGT